MAGLSNLEILSYLHRHKLSNINFIGCFAADKLPAVNKLNKFPTALISNTDVARNNGEHWIVIIYTDLNTAEYFDPLGNPDRKSVV